MVHVTETSNRARFRSCNMTVGIATRAQVNFPDDRLVLVNILSTIQNSQDCLFQKLLHRSTSLLKLEYSNSHMNIQTDNFE